jgi:hypothetical protein
MRPLVALFLAIVTTAAHGGPRSSGSYSIASDSINAGGTRTSSTVYSNTGSITEVTGISSASSPAETVKHGFIGQQYEGTGLQLTSTAPNLNEGTSLQLTARQTLDDATLLALPATSITWSVQNGPLAGINASGLATAATVFQDTLATVQGLYLSHTGTLGLTVLNVSNDDIPGYTGDGLDDAWQVQYFGLGNPAAAPTFDADSDGQDNLFEFIAGGNPINGGSRFLIQIAPVPSQAGQMKLLISPRLPDRTYTVKVSSALGPGAVWTTLTGFNTTDNGTERTITDNNATGPAKFYRVEIVKP